MMDCWKDSRDPGDAVEREAVLSIDVFHVLPALAAGSVIPGLVVSETDGWSWERFWSLSSWFSSLICIFSQPREISTMRTGGDMPRGRCTPNMWFQHI